MPPRNANGTDTTANGQNTFQEKQPARAKRNVPTLATKRFNTRAVGFITSGARPNSAIAARYPDAPPCPTDEYSRAATKISSVRRIRSNIGIARNLAVGASGSRSSDPVTTPFNPSLLSLHAAAGVGGGLCFTSNGMLDWVC